MNDQTDVQPAAPATAPAVPPPGALSHPLSWWLRKLFACNPFYLVSAALLLFSCYRISVDAPLLSRESARLLFNFSAVQIYEVLLVFVAVFLARRRLWYDATLLVGLENLLVFIPFILVSQAALIDVPMAQAMCAAGATVAVLRFGTLKRYFALLNLPGRLLFVGAILLAANVALPLVFRHFGETKIGVHIESGPAYEMNESTWLLILPALLALANLLPRPQAVGTLLPQHRWLPAGIFSLWLLVTGVHVWGLDYVYQFEFRSELFAPAAWVLAWTAFLRFPVRSARLKSGLLAPAILAPWLAVGGGGHRTLLVLCALNIAAYSVARLLARQRLAGHLAYASGLMLLPVLPETWLQSVAPGTDPAAWVLAGLAGYVVFWTAWLDNPKLAVLGSVIFGSVIAVMFQDRAGVAHWAVQSGLVFFLLHSLRWNDAAYPGARGIRHLAGLAWGLASLAWAHSATGRFWMPLIPGALVLGTYYASMICQGKWRHFTVPAAALLAMLSGPANAFWAALDAAPVGLLALVGSFLFLGFGTLAALTRDLWHQPAPRTIVSPTPIAAYRDPVSGH